MKRIIHSVVLALLVVGPATGQADLGCQYMRPIIETISGQHLLYSQFNTNLQVRTIDQYIKTLDPSKMYFLKADVEKIRSSLGDLYAYLSKRDCSALEKVQDIYLERVKERDAFAKKFLGESYKLDKTATVDLDTDKREWATKTSELDKYQGDYIHFQIANFIATEMKLEEAKDQVRRRYERALKNLEEQKIKDLYVNYLDAAARSLDPHSSYLSKEALEDFEIQMRLSLEGIGATLSSQDGYTVIEQLVKGGAAEKSGQLQTQDKIVAVAQGDDGAMESVIDMPLKDVVRLIRGKKGTKVRLSVLRKEGAKTERFTVPLIRQKIALEEEAAKIHYMDVPLDGKNMKVGVIDLPSFYADTKRGGRSSAKDVKKLLIEAKRKKVDGIVLDLSSNGGGSLEDAVNLAGLFFKTGNVVATQGNRGSVDYLADEDPAVEYTGPLVVLTSRLSASASEIVSGALKDYGRAVVVGGDHTFGKGSVQSVLPLPNQLGAIKVTVGMFFIPGGKSTQHQGVEADILLPGAFARDEVGEKSLDYSLPPKSMPAFISKEAFVTTGNSAWMPLKTSWIEDLKKASATRVSKNSEFKKIEEELEKSKAKGKMVTVAEILEKKEETIENEKKRKDKARDAKLRIEEYLKRPDILEAANILADLIRIETKQGVMTAGQGAKSGKKN